MSPNSEARRLREQEAALALLAEVDRLMSDGQLRTFPEIIEALSVVDAAPAKIVRAALADYALLKGIEALALGRHQACKLYLRVPDYPPPEAP